MLVARTAPHIDRVAATTDLGVEIVLKLSDVIDQFGLRFAAAVLPDGHGPGFIRAESQGDVIHTARQRMHQQAGVRRCGMAACRSPVVSDQGREPAREGAVSEDAGDTPSIAAAMT